MRERLGVSENVLFGKPTSLNSVECQELFMKVNWCIKEKICDMMLQRESGKYFDQRVRNASLQDESK